ncbi:hypothetical protein [Niabella drilacis]|uniref:Uncharacterized protein n=1 Tax=Niabella drilacis (strain DSM 25811 / CCM 8410 / CCUG 62505 / LMG 26954 / E90) TaxID=1285928 RepID=A0A1G6ZHF6_NIADE|nr:hypothetical protein [Niabella drilacis]SDE01901.1 hypothetical protein SAMN04487894_11849 [Niabella drilacis]
MKILSRSQWLALLAAIILTIACFMPWAQIDSIGLTLSGIDTTGTRYGKPAYNHFILTAVILVFTLIARIWAKRLNLLFGVLNLAWAIRNFILFGRCEAGDCPERQIGLYLVLLASVILLLTILFPKMELKDEGDQEA